VQYKGPNANGHDSAKNIGGGRKKEREKPEEIQGHGYVKRQPYYPHYQREEVFLGDERQKDSDVD
jgi:hypothetical protein